ncbi:MAG: hypothetical protein ACRDTH_15910 [Pseudonocardiaceae bacterium]
MDAAVASPPTADLVVVGGADPKIDFSRVGEISKAIGHMDDARGY